MKIISVVGIVLSGLFTHGITISGSTTIAKPIQEAVDSYEKKSSVKVVGSSVGGGFDCVRNETCDVGMVSKDLTSSELNEFDRVHIGWDGLAFIVHPTNQVTSISKSQVKEIFCGGLDNWKSITGINSPIIVYNRPAGTGPFEEFKSHFCEPNTKKVSSSGSFVHLVELEPKSIAYVGYALATQAGDKIKVVSYENVQPSTKTIQSGSYPLIREMNLIYKKGSKKKKEILDFLNHFEKSRINVLPKYGLVPKI